MADATKIALGCCGWVANAKQSSTVVLRFVDDRLECTFDNALAVVYVA